MIKEKIAPLLLGIYKSNVIKYLHNNRKVFNNVKILREFQQKRLKKLLIHAYRTTKYYQKVFDEIELIENNNINWEKFNKIPLLTKELIRKNYNDLISIDSSSRNPYENTSGGSTGEPVVFLQDKDYYERMVADTIFFSELYGKKLGEKEIKIWGSEKDIFNEKESKINQLINYFFNRTLLNSFRLDENSISNYLDEIEKVKPKSIWTYVDSIFEISKYINKNKLNIFNPKIIICTAGTMYPEFKQEISKAFPNSKILNQYGSREVGIIGIGEKKIDVFRQSIVMEFFNKNNNKYITDHGIGNIIITSLNNYSMPLIKFDIGDIGESNDIDESGVKSLRKLTGRDNAHIKRNDGSIIHGELFTHLFYFMKEINKFQVIQEEYTKFVIFLEIENGAMESEKFNFLRHKFNEIMDDKCEIEFRIVEDIPKLKSGKYQFVTSKVKHE